MGLIRRRRCGGCQVLINNEVYEITRRLLGNLDPIRLQALKGIYDGRAPKQLCAACMNATAGTLNNFARKAVA
jgi:hypothetical protein